MNKLTETNSYVNVERTQSARIWLRVQSLAIRRSTARSDASFTANGRRLSLATKRKKTFRALSSVDRRYVGDTLPDPWIAVSVGTNNYRPIFDTSSRREQDPSVCRPRTVFRGFLSLTSRRTAANDVPRRRELTSHAITALVSLLTRVWKRTKVTKDSQENCFRADRISLHFGNESIPKSWKLLRHICAFTLVFYVFFWQYSTNFSWK